MHGNGKDLLFYRIVQVARQPVPFLHHGQLLQFLLGCPQLIYQPLVALTGQLGLLDGISQDRADDKGRQVKENGEQSVCAVIGQSNSTGDRKINERPYGRRADLEHDCGMDGQNVKEEIKGVAGIGVQQEQHQEQQRLPCKIYRWVSLIIPCTKQKPVHQGIRQAEG